MSLFAIITTTNNPKVEMTLAAVYAQQHYQVNDTTWVVSTHGETTRQVSARVGFNGEGGNGEGPNAPGVVFAIENYWGRFDKNLWEWIRVMTEGPNG